MQLWNSEDVETLAGVVRLLRRAAELSWRQADAGGPRSPHQLFAVGIDVAADLAANLLPAGSGWRGRRRWVQTRPSYRGLRRTCCVESALRIHRRVSVRCTRGCPSWSGRRTPVPTRDRRTVGELLADSDSLARETLLDLSADHSAVW